MFKKIKSLYSFSIIIICFFLLNNYIIDENILFYADNSTKYFQGVATIHNSYRDDKIRCQWLSEFNYCKYFFISNTMERRNGEIVGAFPFSLSYINAILIHFLNPKWILWLTQILFLLTMWILYKSKFVDQKLILILFFFTPLFFQFYTFLDLAFQIFFLSFFWLYQSKLKKNTITLSISFVLGFLTGFNFYFRLEGIFYLFFVLGFLIMFDQNKKYHLFYGFGIIFSLILLMYLNVYFYNHLLGQRFVVSRNLIFNFKDISKLINIISLLWGDSFRVGFFQYMPIIAFIYVFTFFYFKKLDLFWKIQFLSILLSLICIVILSPNDSNLDYGTRYLSSLIIPSFLLYDFLKKENLLKAKKYVLIIIVLFSFSAYFSYQYYNKLILKINRDSTLIYHQIPEEYKKNTVWIFHSNFPPAIFGAYLMENKVIILEYLSEIEEAVEIIHNNNQFSRILVFHSFFDSNLDQYVNQYDKNQTDRFFYEDELVKEELLKKLKMIGYQFKKKSIYVRGKIVFDIYAFEK